MANLQHLALEQRLWACHPVARRIKQAARQIRFAVKSRAVGTAAVKQLLPAEGYSLLKNDIDTVILDCDGVLWTGSKLLDSTLEVNSGVCRSSVRQNTSCRFSHV